MPLRDILVYVDETERAGKAVAAACALAKSHNAHLNGLAIDRPPEIPGYAAIEIPPSAIEIIRQRNKEALARTREIFDRTVAAADMTGHSGWAVAHGAPLDSLTLRSRYSDLTVIAQNDPESDVTDDGLVDDLVLACGRPVLVIPYIGAPGRIGRRVMVAWNASREAARAVADAMPFLEAAEKVDILSVEPRGMGDLPGADIAAHLARHGVNAEAHKTVGLDIDVGDALLNWTADSGADLIVMGAYGHSRMRELVLGGATRHILEHMTAPVLLSH